MSYGYHWHHIQFFCDSYNKCISTTVDRTCIITTVNRRSVMVHGCCRWNLWEPSGKLRSMVIIRHVLSDDIYTFEYLNSDELFYILSTEGTRLLKLLLQLYHQLCPESFKHYFQYEKKHMLCDVNINYIFSNFVLAIQLFGFMVHHYRIKPVISWHNITSRSATESYSKSFIYQNI